MKKRRIRTKLGDIIAIPLKGERFAFGRILQDCGIAIHRKIAVGEPIPPDDWSDEATLFYTGFADYAVTSGEWPVVGRIPFKNADEAWGPPCRVYDVITPSLHQIYHRGKMRPATEKEVEGLEDQNLWMPKGLPDEIERRAVGDLRSQGPPDEMYERLKDHPEPIPDASVSQSLKPTGPTAASRTAAAKKTSKTSQRPKRK